MIHQYKLNGYNIVIDVASGSVHNVDDVAYDAIEMYEDNSRKSISDRLLEKYGNRPDVTEEDISELLDDIEKLKNDGKLFSKDIYDGKTFNIKNRNPVIKALCLHVAHTCNLNCEYCFAAQGKYHGQSALMSFETGKRALDFLVENSGTRRNLEVDFFGGEPLMNFDVVKKLVAYNNVDFTNDIFHMADLGFTELSMEPVVCKPTDPYALTEEDLPVLMEQYEILAKEMIKRRKEGRPFTFYHYMIDLKSGPCIYKRITGCGSGTEYMAVTPTGELYPCHQFVGDPAYKLGDVFNGIANEELRSEFGKCNAYSREECKNCWARLFCSGGCAANAYHATGSIDGVYEYGCKLFKKRIECAVMMNVDEDASSAENE